MHAQPLFERSESIPIGDCEHNRKASALQRNRGFMSQPSVAKASSLAQHLGELGGLLKVQYHSTTPLQRRVTRCLLQSQVASQRTGAASVIAQLALSADGAELLLQQPDLFVRIPHLAISCSC